MSSGRVYCTDFDSNYLARGVAMLRSLRRFDACAAIQVLALDDACAKAVSGVFGSAVSVVTAGMLHSRFPQLRPLAAQRSRWAFYATEKPAAVLYALEQAPPSTTAAFVDADTWFFSDPSPLFAALGPASIGVSPHRYPPELRHLAVYGEFNAGCILWRNDAAGLRCVRDWLDDCVECCAEELDAQGRYMNQGYLTRWPERYGAVHILEHPGVNLAAWNVDGHALASNSGGVTVDGEPLILFHFSGLVPDKSGAWHSVHARRHRQLELLRESVHGPYLSAVEAERRLLRSSYGVDGVGSVRAGFGEGRGVMTFRPPAPGAAAPLAPEDAELEVESYRRAIRALVDAGKFEAALAVLRAAGPPPYSPRADWEYYAAFCLHSLRQQPDSALEHYGAALELGFDEFWVRFHRGQLLVRLGRKAEGLRDLDRARALRPDHAGLAGLIERASRGPATLWERLRPARR